MGLKETCMKCTKDYYGCYARYTVAKIIKDMNKDDYMEIVEKCKEVEEIKRKEWQKRVNNWDLESYEAQRTRRIAKVTHRW